MALRSYSRDAPYCDQRSRVRLSRGDLPFGSVGYENAVDDKGNRLIWVPPDALAKLKACAAPALASQTIGMIGRRCPSPATATAPPVGFDTRLGLSPKGP